MTLYNTFHLTPRKTPLCFSLQSISTIVSDTDYYLSVLASILNGTLLNTPQTRAISQK